MDRYTVTVTIDEDLATVSSLDQHPSWGLVRGRTVA